MTIPLQLLTILVLCLAFLSAGCSTSPQPSKPPPKPPPAAQTPLFTDMRAGSGIDFTIPHRHRPLTILQTLGHGAALLDYDGDGRLDILLLGPDRVRLYHNDGAWRFSDATAGSGLRQPGFWEGVAVGDYDNDGREDVYLCGYNCSALYHNEGGGHFHEVTPIAGVGVKPPDLAGVPEWRTSAAFVDVDGDGLLDLYVCEYVRFGPHNLQLCQSNGATQACPPQLYQPERGRLFINKGNGRFTDETAARGLGQASGRALGIAIADYDQDGWIDLAIANDERPGDLFHNKGRGYFENLGERSGAAFSDDGNVHGGMGIDWGDYRNEGKLSLLVATFQNEAKNLYTPSPGGMFTDTSARAGLAQLTRQQVTFGARFLDFDNDGVLDIALTSGHIMEKAPGGYAQLPQLFHNTGSGTFEDARPAAGPAFQHPIVGRALCVGDIDNDGREDILISNLEGQPLLLRNTSPSTNHWLTVRLVGSRCNRDAIGAVVTLEAGSLHEQRVVSTTGSYLSASDPRVHFGLGSAAQVDSLQIRWPDGHVEVRRRLDTNQILTLREDVV